MKKLIPISIVIILTLTFILCACGKPVAEGPIKLEAVSTLPSMVWPFKPLEMWIDKVNSRSNGQLIIEYKGGEEVIPAPDQAAAVKSGATDISMAFSAIYEGMVPGVNAMPLSKIYPWEERKTGAFDTLQEIHKKSGLYYLGRGYSHPDPGQFFWIWSIPKIEKPSDFAGKRIGGISPACNPFLQALGASPQVMGLSEVYTALERGVIDGFWIAFTDIVPTGLAEVLPYCIDHGFYCDNNAFIINMDVWNGLPKNLQDIMTQAMIEVEREQVEASKGEFAKHRQGMLDAGMKFVKFSPADEAYYLDTAYSAGWADVKAKYPDIGSKLEKQMSK